MMGVGRMGFWIFSLVLISDMLDGSLGSPSNFEGISQVSDQNSLIEEGKTQYELITRDSKMPKFGACWLKALNDLEEGCKQLTDEVQSRLALNFANCFLEKSGLRPYPCPPESEMSDCLKNVDNNAFTAYSNFFMHTRSMCFFIMSQVWHKETEETIGNLASASKDAYLKIAQFHEKVEETQRLSMEYQRQMIENGTMLSRAIETSKSNVKEMLEEFRTSTDEQRFMIFEIFDRVSKLQNLVLSEVSWIYTVVFYGTCLLVSYVITATRRTAEARLWLFVVLSFNFGVERVVTNMSLPKEGEFAAQASDDLSQVIYARIWTIRQSSVAVCVALLIYYFIKFKDYNKINNQLLEDIRKQNMELQRSVQVMQSGRSFMMDSSTSSGNIFNQKGFDTTDNYPLVLPPTPPISNEKDEDDDNDSVMSFDSKLSDRTFEASRVSSASEEESSGDEEDLLDFTTACNSVVNSRTNSPVENMMNQLKERKDEFALLSTTTPSKKRVSRTSRSSNTPIQPHKYNLRSRRQNNQHWDNPILDSESPNAFGRLVYSLASIAKNRSDDIKKDLKAMNPNQFSSDEDH